MLALLLAAVVGFTYPTYNAHTPSRTDTSDTCSPDPTQPLADLAGVHLYGQARYMPSPILLRDKHWTLPGASDTLAFDDQGMPWTVWVKFYDRDNHESCASNLVSINSTTDVPQPPDPSTTPTTWYIYDILGRAVGRVLNATEFQARQWAAQSRHCGICILRARINGKNISRTLRIMH